MLIELLTKKYPGMRQWLTQRLTALVMAVYIVFLLIYVVALQPNNYVAWQAALSPLWFRFSTILFFICLCMHAWLGVRDVLKDYVFNQTVRGYMQAGVDILLIVYVVWMSLILWNIR
ncbi:MAG: succinate dehydrogenase, hydrophobic membrane anchor protein [Methylophilaceae bacterium]